MSIASLEARISILQAENKKYEEYIEELQEAKEETRDIEDDISATRARVKRLFDNPSDWKGDTRDHYEDILGEDIKEDYRIYANGADDAEDDMTDEIRRLRSEILSNNAEIAYCRARIRAIRAAEARARRAAAANAGK